MLITNFLVFGVLAGILFKTMSGKSDSMEFPDDQTTEEKNHKNKKNHKNDCKVRQVKR